MLYKRQCDRQRRRISKSVVKTPSCIASVCERLCPFREPTCEEHSLLLNSGMPSKNSGTFDSSFSNRHFHKQHFICLYYTPILQPF